MENQDGSTFKVPFTTILEIQPHTNAERLEIAVVYGFQVVVSKGKYSPGDKVVYIPIDSIIPSNIETILFPEDSKIKLNKSRVRQIKIRNFASQGMLVNPQDLSSIMSFDRIALETDLKDFLGITKYEPPVVGPSLTMPSPNGRKMRQNNPLFHKYNGLDNVKWFPTKFNETTEVVIQEKLHGTNARAGLVPYNANTVWKKIKKFLKLAPFVEPCYGSNNVEISAKGDYKGWYGEDHYATTFKAADAFNKLKLGETIFGEIIGPGIQKNYTYGLTDLKFVLFDVKILQEDGKQIWLSPTEVQAFAKERGFEMVPVLYEGPYNKELAYSLTKGNSVYCPAQKVREGIVIKKKYDYSYEGNKQALKWVSEDYLSDDTNTDNH